MRSIDDAGQDSPGEPIQALTKEEADRLRPQLFQLLPMRIVGMQVLVGLGMTGIAFISFSDHAITWSVGYGALAVIAPGYLFSIGVRKECYKTSPSAAMLGFFLWELVKLTSCVAMLAAAPLLIKNLNWFGMLAGLLVTMKVYLFAGWLQRSKPTKI